MLSPPVRRRCCVQRSRQHCMDPQRRLGTRKPLGSCGFRARHAHSRSIVATYMLPGLVPVDPRLCVPTGRRAAPNTWRRIWRLRPRFCATRCPGTQQCRAPSGSSRALQGLEADGVEAARQLGGGLFHPVTAAICFAGRNLAMASLVRARRCDPRWPGPDAAATRSAAGFRRLEGQEHAAAPRWTGQPRPLRRGQYPRRCHQRVPGWVRGSRQKRYASAPTDPE